MTKKLKIGVAGLGRMGAIHALHACELESEIAGCELAALADADSQRARQVSSEIGRDLPIFPSVEALAEARICDAAVIVTPTDYHQAHAMRMIAAGTRVMLEKPLTGTLEGDRRFAAELDRHHPQSLMLAFQRRFDEPLLYAKQLVESGSIGRVFKIYSALEDSNPAPNGYHSGGILPDMGVHNVDEILWFSGRMPSKAMAVGSRVYSYQLTTCVEDFDDASLYLWFESDLLAQIQVSRNHVSGYRVETVLFGEHGQVQVGHFDQRPFDITVRAYGKRGRADLLADRSFTMRDYGRPLPEFVDRFGAAYKSELACFIRCCQEGVPFPTTHRDGVRAQEVISTGMRALFGVDDAASIEIS